MLRFEKIDFLGFGVQMYRYHRIRCKAVIGCQEQVDGNTPDDLVRKAIKSGWAINRDGTFSCPNHKLEVEEGDIEEPML